MSGLTASLASTELLLAQCVGRQDTVSQTPFLVTLECPTLQTEILSRVSPNSRAECLLTTEVPCPNALGFYEVQSNVLANLAAMRIPRGIMPTK